MAGGSVGGVASQRERRERALSADQPVDGDDLRLTPGEVFLQCRLKFWFPYVAQIPKAKTAALHVGGSVHSVLKSWNKARWRGRPLTLNELHDEFTKAWMDQAADPVKWDNDEKEQKRTGWRLLETYFRESNIPAI
jgi:putative RecB family exonuclease